MNKCKIIYGFTWRIVYARMRGQFATREINTKITFASVHKQFVTIAHTLFFSLHDITNPQMPINTTIFTHRLRVSLVRFTFYWWHHNRLLTKSLMHYASTSVRRTRDKRCLDFIHNHIHGRSCKNMEGPVIIYQITLHKHQPTLNRYYDWLVLNEIKAISCVVSNQYLSSWLPLGVNDISLLAWWRHQMETFSALLALCDAELWCFLWSAPE